MTVEFEYTREIKNHCDDFTIDRFHIYGDKIIGVVYELDIQPEENKIIGRVVLKGIAPKFELGQYVKFNVDKLKFFTTKLFEGSRLAVVNAYWCKKYIIETRLKVPIKVWCPKKNEFEVEFQLMSKSQFIARRSREFQANWPNKYALGVMNCCKLRAKGRYFAINSTVRHYAVDQKELESYWGKYNRYLGVLNIEWDKIFRKNFEQDYALRKLEAINNKLREEKLDKNLQTNVIDLRKVV